MQELLLWQNVIFWAPMIVGTLLYALSSLVGGDHDHSEGDLHADVGAEADAAAGSDGDAAGHDAGHDAGHEAGLQSSIWAYFGVGKVPLAAVLASLMFGWGIAGMVTNQLAGLSRVSASIAVAGLFALLFTRIVTRLIARYVPAYQSYSQGGSALFLTEGEVLYTVSAKSGTVRVLDRYNNLRDLDCRVRPDQPPIGKGEKVYVDDYDARTHTYFVRSSVQ